MTTRPPSEAEIDRVRELTSIGAGHAASALALLMGRTCEMKVPELKARAAFEPDLSGVLFELTGGTGGVLGLFFPPATRDRLLEHLLGGGARRDMQEAARSALCEVGNILASYAAGAVGEMVGEIMLPSPPRLAWTDAAGAFEDLLGRHHRDPPLRIASEIVDRTGELRGILVFAPDAMARVAPPGGF